MWGVVLGQGIFFRGWALCSGKRRLRGTVLWREEGETEHGVSVRAGGRNRCRTRCAGPPAAVAAFPSPAGLGMGETGGVPLSSRTRHPRSGGSSRTAPSCPSTRRSRRWGGSGPAAGGSRPAPPRTIAAPARGGAERGGPGAAARPPLPPARPPSFPLPAPRARGTAAAAAGSMPAGAPACRRPQPRHGRSVLPLRPHRRGLPARR